MVKFALGLLVSLAVGPAYGQQSAILLSCNGSLCLSITAHVTEDQDVYILVFASETDALKVAQTTIRGNGQTLTACPSAMCVYQWSRWTMRSNNHLVLTATYSDGSASSMGFDISRP